MAHRNIRSKKSEKEIIAEKIASRIILHEGRLALEGDNPQPIEVIAKGDRGERGPAGKDGRDGKDGYTPQKGIDYFDGKDGINGKDGLPGRNGTDGLNGKDGYTPQKDVDYFDGKNGRDGKDGRDGLDGKNGRDGKDGLPGPKGDIPAHEWEGTKVRFQNQDGSWGEFVDLKGKDGHNGLDGKDGEPGKMGPQGYPGHQGPQGDPGIPPNELMHLVNEMHLLKERVEMLEKQLNVGEQPT